MKSHIKRFQFCFFILLHSGICQGLDLNGVVGEDIILPCVTTELEEDLEAVWKDGQNRDVVIIQNNKQTIFIPKFEGRVTSFPEEYKKGNFSIKIHKLRLDDADYYECDIPKQLIFVLMKLNVTEKETQLLGEADADADADVVQVNLLGMFVVLLISLLF